MNLINRTASVSNDNCKEIASVIYIISTTTLPPILFYGWSSHSGQATTASAIHLSHYLPTYLPSYLPTYRYLNLFVLEILSKLSISDFSRISLPEISRVALPDGLPSLHFARFCSNNQQDEFFSLFFQQSNSLKNQFYKL